MRTLFCLVRHGETDWNVERRIQGHADVDLNAAGEAQALALRLALSGHHFTAVYASDLARALRTARLATQGLGMPTVQPLPCLRERHFGIFQGLTADEAQARHPEAHHLHRARSLDWDYETGESLRVFAARVTTGLDALAARHRGDDLLVFTHGGVLDIVYRAATGRDLSAPRDFLVPNAALNWLEYREPRWTLRAWADCRHQASTRDEVTG